MIFHYLGGDGIYQVHGPQNFAQRLYPDGASSVRDSATSSTNNSHPATHASNFNFYQVCADDHL